MWGEGACAQIPLSHQHTHTHKHTNTCIHYHTHVFTQKNSMFDYTHSLQPSLNSRWPPPQGSKEGGSGRGWEVREISTLLNDQGITPYKGRHSVSFQSCLLATDLVSIIAHTYTLIHTHITHLHIIIFLQFSSISFPLISFFTQCWSLSIVEMCMWGGGTQIPFSIT